MDGCRLKLGEIFAVVLVVFMVVILMPQVAHAATTDRYHGGSGDGFTILESETMTLDGAVALREEKYTGGDGDGFSRLTSEVISLGGIPLRYTGGSGDGFDVLESNILTLSGTSALREEKYTGGDGDGFSRLTSEVISLGGIPLRYTGGSGDGFTVLSGAFTLYGVSITDELEEVVPPGQTDYVVDASDIADTTITVNTTAEVTITVLKFESNPYPEAALPVSMLPRYIDIAVDDPDAIAWPVYVEQTYTDDEVAGLVESSLRMYYYKAGAWYMCSDSGVNTATNTIWANMTADELSGSPIGIGEAVAPVVNAVGLYQSNRSAEVTQMDPQAEYAVKVTITDNDTLDDIEQIKVTVFYDSNTSGVGTPPGSGNAQTAAILTWTKGGSPEWNINPSEVSSSWSIEETSSSKPADMGLLYGDWWFHFKPGKVATATDVSHDWDIYVEVTDSASASANNSIYGKNMSFYMEIGLSVSSIDFGTVVLGGTVPDTSLVAYAVANGNYDLKVKSDTTWQGAGASIDLVSATPGYGEFRLKSDDDDTEDGAISTSGVYQVIRSDASGPTADRPGSGSGGDQVTCGLWLTMGSEGIPAVTYQGAIFYQMIRTIE